VHIIPVCPPEINVYGREEQWIIEGKPWVKCRLCVKKGKADAIEII
jgi:hypothetical protein